MNYLGIEIGGTKLQLALGAGDGTLRALRRDTVDVAAGARGILAQIQSLVPPLLSSVGQSLAALDGAGIGFGGPIDDSTGSVLASHQVAGWAGFPLARWFEDTFGRPACLGNDADVAGLGEALFGAGRGFNPIFYVTLGSGIGGGLVIDGQIYRGCGRGAAEIGHLRVGSSDRVLEQVASGWGIARRARERQGDPNLTAADVAQAAAAGAGWAHEILDEGWDALAEAFCQVIALLCPRRIVVGGGVALMDESLLLEPLRRKVAARVFRPFADCYEIVRAALGEEMVLHGALALAHSHFRAAPTATAR